MKLLKRNSIAISVWLGIIFCQQSTNQVYGFITDSTSGEALIGANVFIRESGQGMATDNNGYYVLSNIVIQEAQLVVSYVGYKRYEKSINFSEIASQNYNIALQPESIELMQVDVTAEEIERLFGPLGSVKLLETCDILDDRFRNKGLNRLLENVFLIVKN